MAEPIKIVKRSEKPLTEYVQNLASATDKTQMSSAAMAVGAMAAALGSLSIGLSGAQTAAALEAQKELEQMREYLLRQVDDAVRACAPLNKRLEEGSREHIDSAARVACSVPSDTIYVMTRNIMQLDRVADDCGPACAATIMSAVYLTLAVIRSLQAQVRVYAGFVEDPVYARTMVREAEMHLENCQPTADALLARLEKLL